MSDDELALGTVVFLAFAVVLGASAFVGWIAMLVAGGFGVVSVPFVAWWGLTWLVFAVTGNIGRSIRR